jgi:hypothetical protein
MKKNSRIGDSQLPSPNSKFQMHSLSLPQTTTNSKIQRIQLANIDRVKE